MPIWYSEFGVACRDYPLAFITTDEGRTFIPVAVRGVAGGENLFLLDGREACVKPCVRASGREQADPGLPPIRRLQAVPQP